MNTRTHGSVTIKMLTAAIAATLAVTAGVATAGPVFVETSHANDGAVYGTGTFVNQQLIVGAATGGNYAGIAFFELPDRNGRAIQSAELVLTVSAGGSMPAANADLYALGYVSGTPTLAASWLLITDTETRNGSTLGTGIGAALPLKVADNIVTAGTAMSVGNLTQTSVAQSIALAAFMNDLYDLHGAVAGDYLVMRINPDANEWQGNNANASKNFRYGSTFAGTPGELTITLVPEPGTLASLGAAGLMMLRRRRRTA